MKDIMEVNIEKLYPVTKETADIIAIELGTLRQYVSRGVIPALYIGRKRVIQASVIERICKEGLKTTQSPTPENA